MIRPPRADAPLRLAVCGVAVLSALSAACSARPMTTHTPSPLAAVVQAALADATRRSGMPLDTLRVQSAEAVTWRDGSIGCPQPGMVYTHALVPGYRVRIVAGDRVLDYHAGRSGVPQWCPAGRAQEPLSEGTQR